MEPVWWGSNWKHSNAVICEFTFLAEIEILSLSNLYLKTSCAFVAEVTGERDFFCDFLSLDCVHDVTIWKADEKPPCVLVCGRSQWWEFKDKQLGHTSQAQRSQHQGESKELSNLQRGDFQETLQCFDSTANAKFYVHILWGGTLHSAYLIFAVMCFYSEINTCHKHFKLRVCCVLHQQFTNADVMMFFESFGPIETPDFSSGSQA